MLLCMSSIPVCASEVNDSISAKTIEVDMSDVVLREASLYATSNTYTKTLAKDYATPSGQTGVINSIGQEATVAFKKTNSPSSISQTTAFAGENANVKFLVRIQGKILWQYTGMDGFTVFGGKMIVTYR